MATNSDSRLRDIAACYSAGADVYKAVWAPALLPHARSLLADLPLAEAGRVLDVGAGTGAVLPAIRLAAPSAAVLAVDCSAAMLSRAPGGFPRVVMDGTVLAFGSGSFDVAVMAFVLPHIPEPLKALSELRRVLRPGGSVGLTTWARRAASPGLEVLTRVLDDHGAPAVDPAYVCHDPTNTPQKVRRLLEAAGFDAVRTRTEPFELRLDPEGFLAFRAGIGLVQRRLEACSTELRAQCMAEARVRLAGLAPDDLTERNEVNLAVARA